MVEKTNYFILVGAPKCGTRSLLTMLGQHPEISVSTNSEPKFFTDFAGRNWNGPGAERLVVTLTSDWESYDSLFAHNPDAKWRADLSTDYLSCPASPGLIADFAARPDVGEVRVAVILRDPVARVVSEYQHTLRDHFETKSLLQSLELEEERLASDMHPLFGHIMRSRYASQIARYRERFDDILILDFHELHGSLTVVNQITDWLGVARIEPVEMVTANTSHAYRFGFIDKAFRSDGLKRIARMIVPAKFRHRVWKTLSDANSKKFEPSPEELGAIRDALRDEIQACLADPGIPTDHWDLALNR